MGPQAWVHRSILVDPRRQGMKRFVNELVKGRKCFRPFAPSVLQEYADEWFDMSRWGGGGGGGSGEARSEAGGGGGLQRPRRPRLPTSRTKA